MGDLKRHMALNNRRNTEVGHLQIDYRITCAMLNYLHKSCCADGINSESIANRLNRKGKL